MQSSAAARLRQPRKRSWTACWTVVGSERQQETHIKCGSVMGVVHPGLRHFFETFMREPFVGAGALEKGVKPRALSPLGRCLGVAKLVSFGRFTLLEAIEEDRGKKRCACVVPSAGRGCCRSRGL